MIGGGDTGNDCQGTALRQGCTDLVGMTASQANETMAYYGLNYALVGASASSEGALVKSQSVPEGTQIQRGSSVTLTLSAGEATD